MAGNWGGLLASCGTRIYCRVCDLALDPVPAKQHFLGRRHEQACLDQCDQHFVCFECGTWCTSHYNLHQHLDGWSHSARLTWLGRSVTPGVPCTCGHDSPMRPASPAPSSNGRAMSPEPGEIVAAAPAAHLQPAPQPPMPEQSTSRAGAVLRCNICDWAGSERAAWDHFRSAAHWDASYQPPATPNGRVACGSCGIWCPNLHSLEHSHRVGARHRQRMCYLAGPLPASVAPDDPAPVQILLPTILSAQPPIGRRPDGEVMVDPVCIADGSSYERSSIQRWFAEHNTSPVTGLAVDTRVVVPNSTLRAVSAMYRRHKGSSFL